MSKKEAKLSVGDTEKKQLLTNIYREVILTLILITIRLRIDLYKLGFRIYHLTLWLM